MSTTLSSNQYLDVYRKHCQVLKQKALFRELGNGKVRTREGCLDFSSTDYLSLGSHPVLLKNAHEFLDEYGAKGYGSRVVSDQKFCVELERAIAKAKKTEEALVFSSAYQVNSTVIQTLLNKQILKSEPLILTDRLIHVSMHMGIRASGFGQMRYRHLDMNHLEDLLKTHASHSKKFIFSQTVFGMDGDVVDLESITFLAKKYEAFLCLDDSHDVGLYGENGYGLSTKYADSIDITVGAFSKALGSFGGFVACSKVLKDYLVNKCSGFMHSTALPPAIIGANLAAWELLPSLDKVRQDVLQVSEYARAKLKEEGFNIGNSSTHIIPLIIGDEGETLALQSYLFANGVFVSAIRPPSIPPGTSRLRLCVCANHSKEDIDRLIYLLKSY